jgi:hypothetical protein
VRRSARDPGSSSTTSGRSRQAQRDLARRLAEIEEARDHERALHAQAVLARERAQLTMTPGELPVLA